MKKLRLLLQLKLFINTLQDNDGMNMIIDEHEVFKLFSLQ